MNKSRKIGRPKKDPLRGGFSENSGFWSPMLRRIGNDLVKRGAFTEDQWKEFSGPAGPWVILKAYACNPSQHWTEEKNRGAASAREWFCNMIIKYPTGVPLFFGMLRVELGRMSELECFLFYHWVRDSLTAGELARDYERATGKPVTVRQVQRALENIYRRVRHFPQSKARKAGNI